MVRFKLEELEVFFPYEHVYPEQYAYMRHLKRALDHKGHCVLEMPTGTGKTVALFSLITAYQFTHPEIQKFIFCTRTVPEVEKALEELKGVLDYREQQEDLASNSDGGASAVELPPKTSRRRLMAVGMSARRNLCVNAEVRHDVDRDKIDAKCRAITAPWVRQELAPPVDKVNLQEPAPNPVASTELSTPPNRQNEAVRFPDMPDIEDKVLPDCDDCNGKLCKYYENLDRFWSVDHVPLDVYTLEDLRFFGSTGKPLKRGGRPQRGRDFEGRMPRRRFCPYFAARRLAQIADVVVLNYQYVLDPKVSQAALGGGSVFQSQFGQSSNVLKGGGLAASFGQFEGASRQKAGGPVPIAGLAIEKEPSVLVFDEAHNIDNVCIEALSIDINTATLERAKRNLQKLEHEIDNLKKFDESRLMDEYNRLLVSVKQRERERIAAAASSSDQTTNLTNKFDELESFVNEQLSSPLLVADQKSIVESAMPGHIRKASFFINVMRTVLKYLDQCIRVFDFKSEGLLTFHRNFEKATNIESSTLKFCSERLKSLFTTIKIVSLEEFQAISDVCDFCTLVGVYYEGFILITDPYPEAPGVYNPVIQLSCLDAKLAMRPLIERYQSIVLTSATISPLYLYPRLLNFEPIVCQSLPMSLDRRCICPIVVARGSDQVPLSSQFSMRSDDAVIGNYGTLLISLAQCVPDGLVCFFTSYRYMECVVSKWYQTGVLAAILKYKLIMMETQDIVSTTLALHNYRKCCDIGRGAVFFSVARGKVAEGVDFDRHYGRCVVLFGVPFQYTLSRVLRARLEFMREVYNVPEAEFLSFDAMRQAAQCVGRVIRSKIDYGLMIFADYRFAKKDKRQKLPQWIQTCMDPYHMSMPVDAAVSVARSFLMVMSQPFEMTMSSRLDQAALNKLAKAVAIRARKGEGGGSQSREALGIANLPPAG